MIRQRGLTMIEVLAATVLLTMLTVACLPILTQALVMLRPRAHDPNMHITTSFELAQLADQFMDELTSEIPENTFGIKDVAEVIQRGRFQLPWPQEFGGQDRHPVTVQCNLSTLDSTGHAWLVFQCASGLTVNRWLQLPPPLPPSPLSPSILGNTQFEVQYP